MNLYKIDKSYYTVQLDDRKDNNVFVFAENENEAVIKFLKQYNEQIFGLSIQFVCQEKDMIK